MFRSDRRCIVVVGAQWGDEGKGKIVDVLADRVDVVVRYQGGANAGHTVVIGDDEFILHQIPSGILHPGTMCVIGNGVVLDPETLLAELDELRRRGLDLNGRLKLSNRAHLVLPLHKMLDRATGERIGTTGRGIGPSYEDKVGRRGLRVGDLQYPARTREIVQQLAQRANDRFERLNRDDRADVDQHIALLEKVAPRLLPLTIDTGSLIHDYLRAGKNVLLEGAQGALLDLDHGTYPFVTSSNTTAGGAATGAGIGPAAIDAVLGVVKAYTTRVGAGPLPTEASGQAGDRLRELGGEFGATTGRPRRCGWFDGAVVRYSARVNGLTDLAVTKLDVLDTIPKIPVCVAYRLDGKPVEEFPADAHRLSQVVPVYEEFEGWCESTADARSLDELPPQARTYLDRIQELVGVHIAFVSVGSRRDQLVDVG